MFYCGNDQCLQDHSCPYGFIGRIIDQDHTPGDPVFPVRVEKYWPGQAKFDAGDIIHFNRFHTFRFFQCIDVQYIINLLYNATYIVRCVFHKIFIPGM